MTRVFIADNSEVVRSGLHRLIERSRWLGLYRSSKRLRCDEENSPIPDILILDLLMPVMDGFQAARAIAKLVPGLPILLFTTTALPASLIAMAQGCGIKGTVSKYDYRQIISGIEALLRRETFFCRN